MVYDINLIPKVRRKVSSETVIVTMLLCICSAATLLYIGFYLPVQGKSILNTKIKELGYKLESYSDTQETYSLRLAEKEDLMRTNEILDTLKSSNLHMTEIMTNLEENIPENIITESMSLDSGLLTIEGVSPSYKDIAHYIVNLRKMNKVNEVTFTSALIKESKDQVAEEEEGDSKNQSHSFTIYVNLSATDVLSDLLLAQTDAMISEGGIQ